MTSKPICWRSAAHAVPKQPGITAERPILELIKRFSKGLTGPHFCPVIPNTTQ
ncbi:hypothetical protein ALP73_00789 [Pseudomonas coronafaciens pv. garcae]|uniref:Uncharacterized protein n=2 Tax=Pseudomonas syringae group TaxID=136849 RepID=A0AAE6UNV5_9PSED|nr:MULTISPECIES: hypothetical protein [Pseudomonas syringae group]QGT81553.1 hypothetical protein GMO17_10310 [Pseudomonas coronafaciens pv. coronafaciens]RMS09120.1 hypothetical protein ALP73_00789 [Pseudomonas coronafaciens pv. garcae]